MKEIVIRSVRDEEILDQLKEALKGTLEERWGERTLSFDNEMGKGVIRNIGFDWGMSLMDCQLTFYDDTNITIKSKGISPVEFIFLTKGNVTYKEGHFGDKIKLEQYQNIIISAERFQEKNFI